MQTAASNSLVITDLSSFTRFADSQTAISHGEFYQLIASNLIRTVHTKQLLLAAGDRLVALAEHAHAYRQMRGLEHLSRVLESSPLPQYAAVGSYYRAVCTQRFGQGDVQRASSLLERVVDNGLARYRVRAIISLGANSYRQCDNQSALSLYYEASRFASREGFSDPFATLTAQRMVGVIKGLEGNHRDALLLMENLFPLAHAMRSVQPHVYYDYMNSLAVELCAVGRLEEARNVSEIVLASPFASAYPEWRETHDQIELRGCRASRAIAAFRKPTLKASSSRPVQEPGKLMRLPLPERTETRKTDSAHGSEPARVLSLHEWKTKMVKQSNGDPQEQTPKPAKNKEKQARVRQIGKMTTREKLLRIMKMIGDERVGDDLLLRALIVLEELETDGNSGG